MCQLYNRFVKLCISECRMCVDCLRKNRNRQFYYLFFAVLVASCMGLTSYINRGYRADGSTQSYFIMALMSVVVYGAVSSAWTCALLFFRCFTAMLYYYGAWKRKNDPESCANIEKELCNHCMEKKYAVKKNYKPEDQSFHLMFFFTISYFTVTPMVMVIERLEKMLDVKELFPHREIVISAIQYAWWFTFWSILIVPVALLLRRCWNSGKALQALEVKDNSTVDTCAIVVK